LENEIEEQHQQCAEIARTQEKSQWAAFEIADAIK